MKIASACLALSLLAMSAPADAEPRLELALSAPPEGFVLGVPVVVHVALRNAGTEAAQVMGFLEPEFGAVVYSIARDGAEPVAFSPWAIKDVADPPVSLAPGEVVEDDAEIFHDGKKWIFTSPGRYRVKARYQRYLDSNELAVEIRAPQPGAEQRAADLLLASPEAGFFLVLRGGDHLKDGERTLNEVVTEAPTTPQASHAGLALGLNQLRPAVDHATGQVRPADPARALTLLEKVDTGSLGIERTAESQLGTARAYRMLNEDAKAREIESNLPALLRRQFPGSDTERIERQMMPEVRERMQ